jgi:hypothetical protein
MTKAVTHRAQLIRKRITILGHLTLLVSGNSQLCDGAGRLESTRNRRRMSQVWSFQRSAVVYLASAHRWTSQRKVFGKLLNKQAVIRSKLAQMIQYAESMQNWLENITYQMNNMVDTVALI